MKIAVIDQIEVTRDGHIQVRMKKQIVDGADVFDVGYHRTVIEVGGDVDVQMSAVSAHLNQLGYQPSFVDDIADIKKYAVIAFKPAKVKAYRDQLDAAKQSLTELVKK